MNNPTESFEPTGYQDDENGGTLGRTGNNEDPTPPQKKKSLIFPLMIGGIVVVGALGLYFMFVKPQPRPEQAPPAQQQAQQQEADPADPVAAGTDPFGDTANQPSVDPTVDPAAAAPVGTIDPVTGLPVQAAQAAAPAGLDPLTGLPMQTAPAPATAPAAVDPMTGLPVQGQPVQGQVAPAPAVGTDPFGNMAVQPAVQQPGSLPQETAPSGTPQASPLDASSPEAATPVSAPVLSNDPLAQFKDMLAPIDGRVTTLEGKVGKLETSMDGLSKKVDALGGKRPAVAPRAPAKKRVVREQPRSNSIKVEQSYRVAPPVSRVIIDDGRVAPRNDVVTVERPQQTETIRAGAPTCTIQAITAGRAWTRRSDGSFVSYAEGDTWVNGQQIETIDPQKGIRAGGRWICM